MNADVTAQLLSMQQGKTQLLAQLAVIKKSHEMEMALVDMLDQATRPAPAPAGQGTFVDKRA